MKFYVNELMIDLFIPLAIASYDKKVHVLIPLQEINSFIRGNKTLYSTIFKQLNEFEVDYESITIMQDWINHIQTHSNKKLLNTNEVSEELINLYHDELNLRKCKISKIICYLNHTLLGYNRVLFKTGDVIEYTTTISYKDVSIPSKTYLHQIFVY